MVRSRSVRRYFPLGPFTTLISVLAPSAQFTKYRWLPDSISTMAKAVARGDQLAAELQSFEIVPFSVFPVFSRIDLTFSSPEM